MTETNIVMDEKGEIFVPWNDGSNKEEMSVDGLPQHSEQSIENDSGERPGLQSPPENKTTKPSVILVEEALQRLKNENDNDAVVDVAEQIGPDVCSEVVCSKVGDENGNTDSLSEVNSSESKPSEEHTAMELKNKISAWTEETLKSPPKSSSEEMKPQKEKASPSQTQPVSNVTPDSPQRKSSVTLQRTTSYIQTESKSDPSTNKDQLYPLRKMQEEKTTERLTHTQAEDLAISDTGQYKIQENAKEHTTEGSFQKPKVEGSETPSSEKDETKAEATAQHQVLQMESSPMRKQPVIQKDVPSEEMKSGAVQLCPEEKSVKETFQLNQVNVVSVAREDINTLPPSNTVIKTQLQSPEETTSVQRQQVLTEAQIENVIDLTKTENTAHEQMLQVDSSMENRPSVMLNNIPLESKQMTTEASHVCPENSLVNEQVSASVHPEDIPQSHSPENNTNVPREVALPGPQIEKTLKNGHETAVKRNIAAESREVNKHGNAEAFTETQPNQRINNSAMEVNQHRENDTGGLVTKTVSDSQEMFPKDVLQEQDQITQPIEQPLYSEPSDVPENLYVEPEEIQVIEDPYVRQQVEHLDHVTLNVAVTGMTGAGKSTFINAIRGIDNDNEKAAPTGVKPSVVLVEEALQRLKNENDNDAVVDVAEQIGPDVCSEVVCSKVGDENGNTDSLSEVNSSESKPSEEHTAMELKNKISAWTEETLKSPPKSSSEEMKPQKEKASPSQTQPVSNVTPDSPQRKSSVTLQRTTSYIQTESKSDPSTNKDQLYPLRKMQEEKTTERLTHTQAEDLAISDTGQYKIQENAKEHTTEGSFQKPKVEGSETPSSEKDETKAEATAQHQVLQMESSPMRKQPVIQKDVPSEEMKSGAVQLCPEEKSVKETIQPNQVNVVSVAREDINTLPPSNTVIKTQLQSPEETTSVQRQQVLTEAQIENVIDLTKTENTVHEQMLQVDSSMENRPSVMLNNIPLESKQMTTEASHVCPENSLVNEQVSASVHPEDIPQSHSPENNTNVPREVALPGPQIEKTLENGHETAVKRNIAAESREVNKHGNAEAFTETQPHQRINNSALEVNQHRENDTGGLVTKTVSDSQEMFPKDVLQEQDQITQPIEQPLYSEPSDVPENLYVEPEEIQVIEDPYVRQQVEHLDHVTLNVAVTGMTGAGKSTFINAIRGIDNDNEKAAPTGVTETSMDVCAYPHPSMPNVNIWDLPGTGSPKFKAKKYLKNVKFEIYDFFIIISSERFKENDMMLAKEILNKKKKFYFLRSKIDNEVHAEQSKKNFNEEKLLQCIREDCENHLKKIVKPTVFLICSFELNKYDFPCLVETLSRDLPEHKKDALTLSLPIYSTEVLEKKIKTLTQTAQSAAKAAGGISVAPVPGLAIACDAGILLGFFTKCYYAFGLDDKSLDKLSERVNNHSLKAVRESRPLVMAVRKRELSSRELSELRSKRAAIEFAYSLVPFWGSKRAASMSHTTTLNLLTEGLKELADTAREVLRVAKIDHI